MPLLYNRRSQGETGNLAEKVALERPGVIAMASTAGKTDVNDDPFNLQRFVDAQSPIFDQVCSELRDGAKRSHWMWFIFPQIEGLGNSELARKFAISSREEAKAYLDHPILGPRLIECTKLANAIEGRAIEQIFGYPDYLKFRSCVTLFANATDNQIFAEALRKYFKGKSDPGTLERL
jgi:uncharacterized protein (DUF1810 family)